MTVNRWQRGALRVNDHTSIDPEAHIGPLARAGYGRVEVLVNSLPSHVPPPTRSWVDRCKKAGMAEVWIVVWADSFASPRECADFCIAEKRRLNANGIVVNAEDGVEERDMRGDWWSFNFLMRLRLTFPKLPLGLDTYIGCGGINLPAWEQASARLIVQTHHEGELHLWPVDGYVVWAKKYGWLNKAAIKPEWSVYKAPDGSRANQDEQVASGVRAGTDGFIAYYAEGSLDSFALALLLGKARAAGVCL